MEAGSMKARIVVLVAGWFGAAAGAAEPATPEELRARCEHNMKNIAAAVRAYEALNDGQRPRRLAELYQGGWVESVATFRCPASTEGALTPSRIDTEGDYVLSTNTALDAPLVVERGTRHGSRSITGVRRDDAVVQVSVPARLATNRPVALATTSAVVRIPPVQTNVAPRPPSPPIAPPPRLDAARTLEQAVALTEAGRNAEALPLLDRVLAQDSGHREARWRRALARTWTGDLAGSVADYDELLRQEPGQAELVRLRTLASIATGQDSQAARAAAAGLLRAQPDNAQVLFLAGQAEWLAGNGAGAQSYFARAAALDPNLLSGIYRQAGAFLEAGVPAMAFVQYSSLVWADPRMGGAYYGAGMAAARLGPAYRARAVQALEQYLRFDATSSFADAARRTLAELNR
jgi:tetratricopeptide (TPR) repeat protein